jgi:hypothetical protein
MGLPEVQVDKVQAGKTTETLIYEMVAQTQAK